MFIIVFIFMILPAAVLLACCVLLALWLAFGRMNLFLRMPLFLAGTIPIGLVCSLFAGARGDFLLLLLCSCILAAGLCSNAYLAVKIIIGIVLAILLTILYTALFASLFESLDRSWIIRVTMGVSLMAAIFSGMRLFGVDIVRLLNGSDDIRLEQHTGRTLDQWMMQLKEVGQQWNHAQSMAYLRSFGMDFEFQKKITLAYRKSRGDVSVGRGIDGRLELVATPIDSETKQHRNWFSMQRFGVWQIMLLTFCAACLFRFTSGISTYLPSTIELAMGIPAIVILSIVAIGLASSILPIEKLSTSKSMKRLVILILCFSGLVIMGAYAIRNNGGAITMIVAVIFLSFVGVLSLLLVHARNLNYRIFRVQQNPAADDSSSLGAEDW